MNEIWSKDYGELARAGRSEFYRAIVRPHHWAGYYVFQAIPHSGGWCVEAKSKDRGSLILDAEKWLAGESPDNFYSSSL